MATIGKHDLDIFFEEAETRTPQHITVHWILQQIIPGFWKGDNESVSVLSWEFGLLEHRPK